MTQYARPRPEDNPSPAQATSLSLSESIRETLEVLRQVAVVAEELNVGTVDLDTARGLLVEVLLAAQRSETPVLGDDDLLAARELVLRATQSLESGSAVWHMVSTSVTLYRPQLDTH